MATGIGDLVVRFLADDKKLKSGIADVNRRLKMVEQVGTVAMKSVAAATAGAAAGFAALAAKSAIDGIREQLQAMDEIAKKSREIGITTEAMVGLRHAAELTGVGADNLVANMEKLTKALGEVATLGTGEAKFALEALGLEAKDLIALSPDEQLNRIADAMLNLRTRSERVAVATKLFGESGFAMVNMLDEGASGLDKMRRETELFGSAFSAVDAKAIEDANDAITRAHAAMSGLWIFLTVKLAPALEATAKAAAGLGVALTQGLQVDEETLDIARRLQAEREGVSAEQVTVIDRDIWEEARAIQEFGRQVRGAMNPEPAKQASESADNYASALVSVNEQLRLQAEAEAEVARIQAENARRIEEDTAAQWEPLHNALDMYLELEKEIRNLGKTSRQAAIDELALDESVPRSMIEAMRDMDRQITDFENRQANKSALPQDMAQQVGYSAAVERGTASAYSIAVNSGNNVQVEQLKVQREQTAVLRNIDQNIKQTRELETFSIPVA